MEQEADPLALVVPVQVSEPFSVNTTGWPATGPALSVSVAATVAVSVASVPAASVWLTGASEMEAPEQLLPISDHCDDSLLLPEGQTARSTPPVLSTCLVSLKVFATPSMVALICGMMPDWLQ